MASTEEVAALRQDVRELTDQLKASKKDREAIHASVRVRSWIIGGLLLLFAGAAIPIGWFAVTADNAAGKANSAAHAAHQNCVNANAARDDNRDLWNSVLSTLDPLTVTPQGKAFVANLHADVDKLTTHRPCPPA